MSELPPRLDELIPALESMASPQLLADWGYASLNAAAPWPQSTLAVVTAPKGGGKTSFALQIAHRFAAARGPVLYAGLEGTAALIASRAYAQLMGVPQIQLMRGERRVDPAMIGSVPLRVEMRPSVERMAELLEKIAANDSRPPLLVIDYVQHLAAGRPDPRVALVAEMSKILDLTETRQMWTLAVSQSSRGGSRRARDRRTKPNESLIDVDAESGVTEDYAAAKLVIAFPTRQGEQTTDATITVAKGRYGLPGATFPFRFDGATGRWTESAARPESSTARTKILAAFDAHGTFANKTACRDVAGVQSKVFGPEWDALVANGEIVRADGCYRRSRPGNA